MQQLRPKETVPVVRHLDDPVDTNQYYIQAIVRDSLNGEVIKTINLSKQSGSQRYTGTFLAPTEGDSGRKYVDVTTKVYSDSGYTTQDSQYGDENVQYVVAVDWSLGGPTQFGFGSGPDIDYKKIAKIVDDRAEKTEAKIPTKEIKNLQQKVSGMEKVFETIISPELEKAGVNIESLYDKADSFDVIEKMLRDIKSMVGRIKIPEPKPTDLKPVTNEIKALKVHIDRLPSTLPKPQEIDINVVVEAINDLADIIGESEGKIGETLSKNIGDIEKKVANRDVQGIKKSLQAKLAQALESVSDEDLMEKEEPEEKEDDSKKKRDDLVDKLLS